MQNLTATLVQCELAWESPAQNREHLESLIAGERDNTDIVVLPEMFTTGFSMNAEGNAEPPGGDTEQWLRRMAAALNCAVTGSIATRDGNAVFNRMLFATPDSVTHYDKRHLFRMAGEEQHYAPGHSRVCVTWRGWRVLLQVCYDLRFPVFSRNRGDYDLALYVANWPVARREHWRCLLQARAIENLACVVGVNRVGEDGNGLHYSGDSLALDAHGHHLADMKEGAETRRVTFDAEALAAHRERFPFHLDADDFSLPAS
ncbi:amidohydrolase [Chromatocurvus halotolerans]|uniref:Omega-amidase YafV n=1 Tax=Chromatocurvus halotolerans TaxID=1132028 RepID=A0A4V2SBK3_9GAMM|nr:amidohydrolase [Chromatocurvus halotolerans]TCO75850.1 putative amidohydrolase [Chromatocurvus halotolerans]